MTNVAEFTVEADGFPLGSVFHELPGATVELERLIPVEQALIPYFWLRGDGSEDVEAAFCGHPHISGVSLIDEVEDEYLLRVEWKPEAEGILRAIAESNVSLLSAVGTSEEWRFEVRAEEADGLSTFQAKCREFDISVTLTNLSALAPMQSEPEYGLTDTQREALVLAWERGFYRSPRDVTLNELAGELDITGQSLGSRLRRGTHRLIASTLIGSTPDG